MNYGLPTEEIDPETQAKVFESQHLTEFFENYRKSLKPMEFGSTICDYWGGLKPLDGDYHLLTLSVPSDCGVYDIVRGFDRKIEVCNGSGLHDIIVYSGTLPEIDALMRHLDIQLEDAFSDKSDAFYEELNKEIRAQNPEIPGFSTI